MRGNITNVYANPSSNTILPTVRENMKYRELPAAVTTTAVPFVRNVPSHLKTVLTDAPDTTPVTGVPPASLIPTVTFLTSPAPMAVRLTTVVQSVRPANPTTVVQSVRPANPTLIAVRQRFPVTTDVPRPTPAVSARLAKVIQTAT